MKLIFAQLAHIGIKWVVPKKSVLSNGANNPTVWKDSLNDRQQRFLAENRLKDITEIIIQLEARIYALEKKRK